jgi:mxaJ protein
MRSVAAMLALSAVSGWLVWNAAPGQQTRRVLRVCADPNNLPFSNERQEGFENRIAEVVARDLGARLEYTWWAQRRGYIRNTLKAGECDVLIGVASHLDLVATTRPYYRSTYVFVSRRDRGLHVGSLDAPVLRKIRIGVQIIGDDYANTPPAHALGQRRIFANVRGYRVIGNYAEDNPPARIIDAVASSEVDVAIAWGPLAGYFAKHSAVPLTIEPVSPQVDKPALPFVYDISMGVRRGDTALRDELDRAITRNRSAIDAILADYGVPLL